MKLFSSEYSVIYKIQNKRLKQYRNVPTRAHDIVVVVQVNTTLHVCLHLLVCDTQ